MQDGGFNVPPDKIREYMIFLEKFINENPDFILISDAKDILDSYLMIYLEGVDNSNPSCNALLIFPPILIKDTPDFELHSMYFNNLMYRFYEAIK